jgi:hypothetical protein
LLSLSLLWTGKRARAAAVGAEIEIFLNEILVILPSLTTSRMQNEASNRREREFFEDV